MEDNFGISCAISGLSPTEAELKFESEDGLPLGWTVITVKSCVPNPRKELIRQNKREKVAQAMTLVPKEASASDRANYKRMVRLNEDALYHAIDSDTPEVLTPSREFYLAPVARCPQVPDMLKRLQELLGTPQESFDAPEPEEAA